MAETIKKAKHLNTNTYNNVHMGTQISIKLSDKMVSKARKYANAYGYDTVQDFIRELLREKLFEKVGGAYTAMASEQALAKHWLSKKEDDAWAHLQEEK